MGNIWSALEGGVVGVAVGEAGAAVVEPALEPARQAANSDVRARILELRDLAELVATTLQTVDQVTDDAHRNGYADDQLLAAVQLALRAPGPPEAERLYLRQLADPAGSIAIDQLHHAYAKAGLEFQYWDALTNAAATALLSPAQLALGIVRGTVTDPGLMVVTLDTGDSNVPRYTPAALDTLHEAAASGYGADRLRVLVGSIGLPPSVQQLASMRFRNIITDGAYNQGILEGDARPEWAPYWLEQAREILTAREYVEGQVRGQLDPTARLAGTARHGMSQADSDLLYQISGRGIAVHAITTAIERGGAYPGSYANVPEPYRSAIERSLTRPEFSELAYANRYTYPSAFVLRSLAQAGSLGTTADVDKILREIGWRPDLATKVAAAWVPVAAPTDPALARHLRSAVTTTITAVRKAYTGRQLTATEADTYIANAEAATSLTAVWDILRTVETLPPAPPAMPTAELIAEAEAAGYTVTPPPPAPPPSVAALEALGYVVTKPYNPRQ